MELLGVGQTGKLEMAYLHIIIFFMSCLLFSLGIAYIVSSLTAQLETNSAYSAPGTTTNQPTAGIAMKMMNSAMKTEYACKC